MRNVLFWMLMACVLFAAATSRSDVASPPNVGSGSGSSSEGAPPEPISGEAVMPNPGSESEQMPPFTMYSHGGSNAVWSYSQLSPAEQAYVDNLPNKEGDSAAINSAYASASRERAEQAAASAAATQMGVANLAETGVIP